MYLVTDVFSDGFLVTDAVVIFFGTEIALEKAQVSVDTSHSLPLTLAYSFPLTWALGVACKTCKSSRGWR
jgi:hypothetical protein